MQLQPGAYVAAAATATALAVAGWLYVRERRLAEQLSDVSEACSGCGGAYRQSVVSK